MRSLAVAWCLELLPSVDGAGQRALADLLLAASHDQSLEVQRAAVLALGRFNGRPAYERLRELLEQGAIPVRAAAARALARQSHGTGAEAWVRQRQVIPALQKALDDPALEVVAEAAEGLGALGLPEAGPVLAVLLHHPSQQVRQTAALALERVADALADGEVRDLGLTAAPMLVQLRNLVRRRIESRPLRSTLRRTAD